LRYGNRVAFYVKVLLGLFFLFLGGRNLFPDLSVAWKTDDPLPRAVLDLVLIGVGAYVLGLGVYGLRLDLGDYRALLRLAHSGKPVPGEIINSQLLKLKVGPEGIPEPLEVKIDYVFKTTDGNPIGEGSATMAPHHLSNLALPSVGTKVAIWHAEKEGAMLL
jgi:hypothetical protein